MVINEKFGERNYNGNPLEYFIENFEVYRGMNRNQLSKFDSGLYKSLVRAGQLEQAIPNAKKYHVNMGRRVGKGELNLSEEDISTITKSYQGHEGNASEASRHLPYSISTILKYWKKSGFEIHKKGSTLSQEKIQRIVDSYKLYDGNALRASKYIHRAVSTVLRHWKIAGLKIQTAGKPKSRI